MMLLRFWAQDIKVQGNFLPLIALQGPGGNREPTSTSPIYIHILPVIHICLCPLPTKKLTFSMLKEVFTSEKEVC